MNEILEALREEYPQFKAVPDDQLLEGVYRAYPDALKNKSFRADIERTYRQRTADTETAELSGDPGYLEPGGRAILRGLGRMYEGYTGAQEALAAAPRVYLGDNPVTRFAESLLGPSIGQRALAEQAGVLSDLPTEAPARLSEAVSDGAGPTAAWLLERGLEQVPQAVGSIGPAAFLKVLGLASPFASAIIGEAAPTFLQEAGLSFRDLREQGVEAPLTAATVGAVNAGLEALGGAGLLQRALGGGDLVAQSAGEAVRKGAGRALTQGLRDSATEAGQELSTSVIPAITGQAEVPRDLGERLIESAAAGFGPGAVGSGAVDILSGRSAIRPPTIPPEVTAQQELGDAMGRLRESALVKRTQDEADNILANQIGSIREQANAERAAAEQAGIREQAEASIRIKESLSQVDALLERASKRPSITPDIPVVEPGQFGEASLTLQGIAQRAQAEQERIAGMTEQQRSALEMLTRGLDVQPVNRLQQAAAPDTLSDLGTPDTPTVTPTPIDWLISQARQARPQKAGPVDTDPGLQSASDVEASPVDQFVQQNRPVLTDSGLSTMEQEEASPVDDFIRTARRPVPTDSGLTTAEETSQSSPFVEYIQNFRRRARAMKAAKVRSEKSALRRASRVAKESQPTKRQSGAIAMVGERYAPILERLASLPEEEQSLARRGEPKTDEGWALREILKARELVDNKFPDANEATKAYVERRYQERVLALLDTPRKAPLGPSLLKSRSSFLNQAMASARQGMGGVGQVKGQSEVSIQGASEESAPALDAEMSQPEATYFKRTAAIQSAQEAIQEFISQNDLSGQQVQAAINLVLKELGLPPAYTSRDTDRQLAEKDPDLQSKVKSFVAENDQYLRTSLGMTDRVSIGLPRVRAAVEGVTKSSRVTVVDNPSLMQDGRPVAGYITPDGKIVINAAYIDSEQQAREVVLEELMHAVFGEADVQSAWDQVKASVTQEDIQSMVNAGYSPDVATEEAAIRKVVREVEKRRTSGPVSKFIQSVVNAIKRVFGVTGEDPYALILKRALEAGGPGVTGQKFSLSEGRWKSTADLGKDIAGSGDVETIRQAAAQQGLLIPENTASQILATESAPKKSAADRVFLSLTRPLLKVRQLAGQIGGPSSWGFGMSTGLADVPESAADFAAEAVIKENYVHQHLRDRLEDRLDSAMSKVEKAVDRLPEAAIKRNDALLYQQVLDGLVRGYTQDISDQIRTAKASENIDANQIQELSTASRNILAGKRNLGPAIASTLRLIAREIPEVALSSPQATLQWIEARLNDTTQPSIASEEVRAWLLTPPAPGKPTPLSWDARLSDRLSLMKKLDDEKSGALTRIEQFKQAITGGKRKPSTKEILTRYADYRQKYRDIVEEMKLILKEVESAEAELDGVTRAKDLMDRMVGDPGYNGRLRDAIQRLNAFSTGVRLYGRDSTGRYVGTMEYRNPLNGKVVSINLQPDYLADQKAIDDIQALMRDVQTWMQTADDPLKKAAWERELQWLADYAINVSPGLMTGLMNRFGIRLPSIWQVAPIVGRAGSMRRVDARNNLYKRVGHRAILPAHLAGQVTDLVGRWLEQRQNSGKHNETKIKLAIADAIESHGRAFTGRVAKVVEGATGGKLGQFTKQIDPLDVTEWWEPMIAEPIIAAAQNPTSTQFKVGDYVNGYRITKEDMVAIQEMKGYQRDAGDVLQKNVLGNQELVRNPLQQQEEFADRTLVRRATDYGLKMARTLNDRMVQLADDWRKATQEERLAMLDQHFPALVMGFIRETNKEWNGSIDDKDKQLWEEIRVLEKENTIPFNSFEGYLEYAAENLEADEEGADVLEDARERFLRYVTTATENIGKLVGQEREATEKEFEKKGLAKPVIQAIGGGANPFLTARGKLVAPSVFYSHSIGSDPARARYKSNALNALTLREIEAVKVAVEALRRERRKYDGPNGLIDQARKSGTRFARLKIAARSQQQARAGEIMTDYRTLVDNLASSEVLLADLERLAAEHIVTLEDTAPVAVANEIRKTLSGSILASLRSVTTNAFGVALAGTVFRHGLGTWRFLTTPVSYLWQASKDIAAAITQQVRRIPGIDPTIKAAMSVPGFDKVLQAFINNQLRWEQLRGRTQAALLVDTPNLLENLKVVSRSPLTYGRTSDEQQGPVTTALNWMLAFPLFRQLNEFSKATFPGAVDRMGNVATYAKVSEWMNALGEPARRAWELRDNGTEGWDDLSNPANALTPEDIGVADRTSLKTWRDLFLPVGSLERLTLDYYKRTKGMSPKQREGIPLLNEQQMGLVAMEALKDINLPTSTTTPTIQQGKGLSGSIRRSLFMFQRYVSNLMGKMERTFGSVPGDGGTAWRAASLSALVILMLLLGGISKDIGQAGTEFLFKEPRTVPSFAQTIQSDQWEDYAKYLGVAMGATTPFWGERIAEIAGSSTGRGMMDATKMFLPFSLVADVENTARRIVQTGDAYYPITDLIRRYAPMAGAVMNTVVDPADAQSRAAMRAARLGATADMEVRQAGGGAANRETPMTPLIRRAANALISGDTEEYQDAYRKAVDYKVSTGMERSAAERSVQSSIAGRDPASRVFGRQITPEEETRLVTRMSPAQRRVFGRARSAFRGVRTRGVGRSRRRTGLARRRRRSALRR